jgi:hypothetical protein
MDETPAERNKPEDRNMAGVTPSPGFDLESYISNYTGRFVVVLVVLPLTNFCFRLVWRYSTDRHLSIKDFQKERLCARDEMR